MNKIYQNSENELIAIEFHDNPENPRDFENVFTLAFWSIVINGDKNIYKSPSELLLDLDKDNYIIFPVYAFIHSSIAIRLNKFNCNFDSGFLGYGYAKKSDIRKMFNCSAEKLLEIAEQQLKNELDTYEAFLNGDVYLSSTYKINIDEIMIANRYIEKNDNINVKLFETLKVISEPFTLQYFGSDIFKIDLDKLKEVKKYSDIYISAFN